MSVMILCTGKPVTPLEGSCSSAGFDSAAVAAVDSAAEPYNGRKITPADRRVYIAEGGLARSTAVQLLEPCEWRVEPLLNEIQVRSFTDTDRLYPVEKWLRRAAAQRKTANPRQPESEEAVIARADTLIRELEAAGGNSLLISYPFFLKVLLDRFHNRSYVVQRSGVFRIQPLERIIVSRKDEHCGGCQHNCFLSNPGCGVGRDKAMRGKG